MTPLWCRGQTGGSRVHGAPGRAPPGLGHGSPGRRSKPRSELASDGRADRQGGARARTDLLECVNGEERELGVGFGVRAEEQVHELFLHEIARRCRLAVCAHGKERWKVRRAGKAHAASGSRGRTMTISVKSGERSMPAVMYMMARFTTST